LRGDPGENVQATIMQLETATSRSSEAALAGWISSNDITLFTVVLVAATAIFLHGKLDTQATETARIEKDKLAIAQRLQATAVELDASQEFLQRTRSDLKLTQEQRDQVREQIIERLDEIARLNLRLDTLTDEKVALEEQRRSLTETNTSLTEEKAVLLARQGTLTESLDSLTSSNADLQTRLETISRQLTERIAALEQIESERERLKTRADELDAIVTALQQKLAKSDIGVAEAQQRAEAARTASTAKIEELENALAEGDKRADEYLARLRRATALFEGLQAEKTQLQKAMSEAQLEHQVQLLKEAHNNRMLVGLTGRLDRVAILFDASGSMRQATAGAASDRWAEAQAIAATWLQHLNIQQCVLIVFSNDVRTFPDDGTLADLRGKAGTKNRDNLLQHLKAVNPGGWTNTYAALSKAYEYDVDSILLFSDGAPSKSISGHFDSALAEQIYQLCRQRSNVPIHTIGLGNYFDQNMSTFLQSVAKITGGTFRGQ
jgi:septal ring factor EnvC (AmiA/AmiB activator)